MTVDEKTRTDSKGVIWELELELSLELLLTPLRFLVPLRESLTYMCRVQFGSQSKIVSVFVR